MIFFDRVSNTADEMAVSLGLEVLEVIPHYEPIIGECETVILKRDELSRLETAFMSQLSVVRGRIFDIDKVRAYAARCTEQAEERRRDDW